MKLRFGIGITAFILTSAAFAADGYTFKPAPKEGDSLRYQQTAKLDLNGMEIDFSAKTNRKVIKVEANGNVTIKEEVSDMKINGSDAPDGAGPGGTTATMSAKGELLKLDGDRVDESAFRMANLGLFILPDKAVNANDTWTYDIKEDKKTGAVAAKATYTFVGDDKVGTIDAVKVKYLIKEVGDSGASTEGAIWLRKSDNAMVKLTSKWVNVPITGAGPISGDVTETLIQ